MKPEYQVVIGTMMLAAGLCYAWWVNLRVWMLRQDLFSIRDELWDSMRRSGRLDDPVHRELRASLNAFVRVAPLLSIFTLLRILAEGAHPSIPEETTKIPEIEAARGRVVSRIVNYLFFETLMGWATVVMATIVSLLILMPSEIIKTRISRMVEKVMDSTELVAMGAFLARTNSPLNQV